MKLVAIDRSREPLVGVRVAAEYLGFSCGLVRTMARHKRVPVIAFPMGLRGKQVFKFRLSELEGWVESLRNGPLPVPPPDQPASRAG